MLGFTLGYIIFCRRKTLRGDHEEEAGSKQGFRNPGRERPKRGQERVEEECQDWHPQG